MNDRPPDSMDAEPWCDDCLDYNHHAPYGSHAAEAAWDAGQHAAGERRTAEFADAFRLAAHVSATVDAHSEGLSAETISEVLHGLADQYRYGSDR